MYQPTVSACPGQCGAGKNWKCAGGYSWPLRPVSPPVSVMVHLTRAGVAGQGPLSFPNGVDIAACSDFFAPTAPPTDFSCGSWTSLLDYGNAQVPLKNTENVFSLRGPLERHRIYPRPIVRSGPLELIVYSLLPDNAFALSLAVTPGVDPNLGFLAAYTYDCLGEGGVAQASLTPMGTAQRFSPGGPPGENPEPSTFFNVSPGLVEVDAAMGGATPSRKTVIVAPGALTTVYLYPPEH